MSAKVGLVAALAMVVTVGGVYAQWSYAQNSVGTVTRDKVVGVTGVGTGSARGSIAVNVDGLSITVDDTDGDYYGDLVVSGKVVVNFTPAAAGVDNETKTQGIKMKAVISLPTPWTYDFGKGNGTETVFELSSSTELTTTGRQLTWEIPAETIDDYIALCDHKTEAGKSVVYLPEREDYDAFVAAINQKLQIAVTDVTDVQ